ncbi:MAG: VOC family protein [Dehalococcoidales bacterium]|nr:VOC family protein [Dehalococcoidales bacterium]
MADKGIVKLGDICQIGIAVRDADKVVEAWSKNFGFSNWRYVERGGIDAKGRPWKTKLVMSKFGPVEFELIQPLEGRIVQSRLLETYGEGIHHIAFPVPDVAKSTAQLEGREGIKIVLKGDAFTYAEIPGGVTIELLPPRS